MEEQCACGAPVAPRRRRRRLAAACVLALAACGAGGDEAGGTRAGEAALVVAAASDLAQAMPELTAAFERQSGAPVVVSLGSTGLLAQQIRSGAPIDIFLAADRPWIDALIAAGHVDAATTAVYAYGRLVLVWSSTAGTHAQPGAELAALLSPAVRRVAIANPEHAPYGRAARDALIAAGVWDALQPKLVLAENVRQTLQWVESGNVDAALTALPLVPQNLPGAWLVPDRLHAPLEQTLGVVTGRPATAAALAETFAEFLTGAEARAILERHRFGLPPERDR